MRRPLVPIASLLLAALLPGCSSGGGGTVDDNGCKVSVLATARSWYLYQDLLPTTVELTDYSGGDDLLTALTAAAQAEQKDRGWSYLMPEDEYVRYFQDAQSIGYGLSLLGTGAAGARRLLVKQVFEGSAAAGAGFLRGDEILALGTDPGLLAEVASLEASALSALLSAGAVADVPMTFRVAPAGGGAAVLRTMVSAAYDVDPVPSVQVYGTTGYVQLRTFIAAADQQLRDAFARFQAEGVQDVVVDLRYNGGGSVETAALLANLLAAGLDGSFMVDLAFNEYHGTGERHLFRAQAESGAFRRVAFITTGGSASASELVPNVLDAYPSAVEIGYVGAKTYGKPVGQVVFDADACGSYLFLIAFRLVNANGNVDYFGGLPNEQSSHPLCGAADDLQHPQDSRDEASTRAAIYFAEHGECPPVAEASQAPVLPAAVDQLAGTGRGPAARDMPGTF